MQEMHADCCSLLFIGALVIDNHGTSWLRLGCGKDILRGLRSLPADQADMRVRSLPWTSSPHRGPTTSHTGTRDLPCACHQ